MLFIEPSTAKYFSVLNNIIYEVYDLKLSTQTDNVKDVEPE